MWLELAITRGLLLAFITILHRNTVKAEEQTTNLTNVLSTVITEPPSNISLQSSVHSQTKSNTELLEMRDTSSINKLATNGYSIISKEITDILDSTPLLYSTKEASSIRGKIPSGTAKVASSTVYRIESSPLMASFNNSKKTVFSIMVVQTSTTSKQETSHLSIRAKERNENATREIVSQKHSVSMVIGSSIQPTPQNISHKSTTLIPVAFSNHEQSSVTLGVQGKTATSDTGKNKVSVSVSWETSKIMMLTTTPVKPRQSSSNSAVVIMPLSSGKSQFINVTASAALPESKSNRPSGVETKENTSITFIRATKSYTKAEVSYSKNMSEKAQMKSNSTSVISSLEVKQANKTSILEPSPSLVSKPNRSETNVVFASPVVKITEMLYSKMSKATIFPTQNDTMVQHSISSSELLAYNYTSRINATKEKIPDKTTNLENMTTSSLVATLHNKTLIPTLMTSTKSYVSSGISVIANRTMMESHILISGPFIKMSSNQTQIAHNFTTFGVTLTSTILSFYKTNRTEEIQVSPSVTMVKKPEESYTTHATGSTSSISNVEISGTTVEIKPTSTTLSEETEIQYSTQVSTGPTSSPAKLILQQFRVTIKITSEIFRKEYITISGRESRQKSKEIEEQCDEVFKNMKEYIFTEVLRFFNGSLGCDLIIHTESVESKPVAVDEINNILNKAKRTEGGFGKFVVGDIDVDEKIPDVQGKDEDKDKKETWGRLAIIVISILAGVCLVLLVIVITQCIQKRHYSHSLTDTNEIQEYSPAIQLKYHDDDAFKDDERVPMTTFNQTDIY